MSLLQVRDKMAERIGFEPTVGYPTTTFQAVTLNHSDTSPYQKSILHES